MLLVVIRATQTAKKLSLHLIKLTFHQINYRVNFEAADIYQPGLKQRFEFSTATDK
jgi:hypothetical protein